MSDEFRSWLLPAARNPFEELLASVRFDDVARGRCGTVLVKLDDQGQVPLVRTTTPYPHPAQPFRDLHDRLAQEIRSGAFNNALIEHYTNAYATMKGHSDQALDLAAESTIAIYSCYRDPDRPSRRLLVTAKESRATFEIPLAHHSVVAFSLDTNRRFTHAIKLVANAPDNEWLGITFRTSKTLVHFVDAQPYLGTARLTLADDDQRREFFQLRRRENAETSFTYPTLPYTLSEGDLRPPASPG